MVSNHTPMWFVCLFLCCIVNVRSLDLRTITEVMLWKMAWLDSTWHLSWTWGTFCCALKYDFFLHSGDRLTARTYAVMAAKMMGSGTSWAVNSTVAQSYSNVCLRWKLVALISEEKPHEQAKSHLSHWKWKQGSSTTPKPNYSDLSF